MLLKNSRQIGPWKICWWQIGPINFLAANWAPADWTLANWPLADWAPANWAPADWKLGFRNNFGGKLYFIYLYWIYNANNWGIYE